MARVPGIDAGRVRARGDAGLGARRASWSWPDTLANAHPGQRYEVEALLSSVVREGCHRRGLYEGDQITCVENQGIHRRLVLRRRDGRRVELEREYAWFVAVRSLPAGREGPS